MKLIPFITAGYPSLDVFWENLRELDANGADTIEIGVPYSDPVADGPVIKAASRQALANGATLRWILDGLLQRKGQFKARLVLMGYLNSFLLYGFERLAAEAAEIGIYGFIIPGLPLEEGAECRALLGEKGIHLIPLVATNTSLERMRQYAAVSTGFVYLISVLGTTGERQGLADGVLEALRRTRQAFDLPIALGFGLSHPSQLDAIPPPDRPDAVIFGSALIRHIGEGGSVAEFMRQWQGRETTAAPS